MLQQFIKQLVSQELLAQSINYSPLDGVDVSIPSIISFSESGIWKMNVFIDQKRIGIIIVDVKQRLWVKIGGNSIGVQLLKYKQKGRDLLIVTLPFFLTLVPSVEKATNAICDGFFCGFGATSYTLLCMCLLFYV